MTNAYKIEIVILDMEEYDPKDILESIEVSKPFYPRITKAVKAHIPGWEPGWEDDHILNSSETSKEEFDNFWQENGEEIEL